MPLYEYKAISHTGESIDGRYNAKDRSEIIQMLRSRSYHPIMVREVAEGKDLNIGLFGKVKTKDIAVFARQFYAMLHAGVTIIQCLDILRQQTEKPRFKAVIDKVFESVQKGSTLSEAMKEHRDVFPELFINMVEAGETSGNLDSIMDRMAVHYEKETKIQNKIRSAMTYPIILAVVSVTVVIFMLVAILPTFLSMFEGSGVPLPGPTRFLLGLSNGIRQYWYIILLAIIILAYGIHRYINTDAGRKSFDQLKLKIPVIKNTVVKVSTSRFTRTLSTLLASGIPLLPAMDIVAKIVGNRIISDGILSVKEELRKGYDLAGPIRRLGLFPPMVDSMIRIGEESGALDDVLNKTADFYDEEVDVAIQKMTSMLEPLMLIVMAVVIGFLVVAMYLPMIDMMQTIQ
ncbi:MAG TPA: type II secretion system F family protein [Clostridiales bacterium]|nr:type II secretion system F family protein [Clostridiales bacterium]